MSAGLDITRKEFLFALGAAAAPAIHADNQTASGHPKVLLVVAHPDDEYAFAATVYRITKELHGIADQVVITNGEAGYRYSQLAEQFYGAPLTDEHVGRTQLPEIRRKETLAAGRILGIRHHHFLEQVDSRYTLDAAEPLHIWDAARITGWLTDLIAREHYDFVFTLLPTSDTHGHHQAATVIALEAVGQLPASDRPTVLAGDPAPASEPIRKYAPLSGFPVTKPWPDAPVYRFNRTAHFGFNHSLSYQIVVNWVIAEHKSQGLFQTDCNKHDEERFWLLATGSPASLDRANELFATLNQHPESKS